MDTFNPADDYSLIRLLKKLEGNPPSFYQRLLNADNTNTGILTMSQYTKALEACKIPPQDVMSMLRIAKVFDTGTGKIRIKEFMGHLSERAELREKWEKDLFRRVSSYFKESHLELADAFAFFDSDSSGNISIEEMEAAFNTMKIRIPRQDLKAIFAVIDKDHNGSISLEEFSERLFSATGESRLGVKQTEIIPSSVKEEEPVENEHSGDEFIDNEPITNEIVNEPKELEPDSEIKNPLTDPDEVKPSEDAAEHIIVDDDAEFGNEDVDPDNPANFENEEKKDNDIPENPSPEYEEQFSPEAQDPHDVEKEEAPENNDLGLNEDLNDVL